MRLRNLRNGLTCLLLLNAGLAFGQSEGVAWRSSLEAAQAEAKQTGKLVLAHFWTESCGPCRQLEARVFAQPSVALALSNSYVPVKINANQSPELAQAYGVTRVPTDAVVTAEGKLVKTFVSPSTPMEYVGVTTRLASAYKTHLGGPYAGIAAAAKAANASPAASTTPNGSAPPTANAFNEAYAQMMGEGAAPQAASAGPPTQANPYATQTAAAQPAPQQPPVTPIGMDQPPQTSAPTAVVAAPKLPAGSPPLGFEGHCPVTLKTENRWATGDVRFGAIHRGRTYLFTSAEAQKSFLASPDAFSPVLSGSDPVVAVDERRAVAGSRDYGVEYPASGGRFYLFSSEESLEKFWSNPSAYAQGAQRVAALPAGETFIR